MFFFYQANSNTTPSEQKTVNSRVIPLCLTWEYWGFLFGNSNARTHTPLDSSSESVLQSTLTVYIELESELTMLMNSQGGRLIDALISLFQVLPQYPPDRLNNWAKQLTAPNFDDAYVSELLSTTRDYYMDELHEWRNNRVLCSRGAAAVPTLTQMLSILNSAIHYLKLCTEEDVRSDQYRALIRSVQADYKRYNDHFQKIKAVLRLHQDKMTEVLTAVKSECYGAKYNAFIDYAVGRLQAINLRDKQNRKLLFKAIVEKYLTLTDVNVLIVVASDALKQAPRSQSTFKQKY